MAVLRVLTAIGGALSILYWLHKHWRSSPIIARIIVRAATKIDAEYYSDFAKLVMPTSVEVLFEVDSRTHNIEFVLGDLCLGTIRLPDTRVYRTIPACVVRSAFAATVLCLDDASKAQVTQQVHEAAFAAVMRAPWDVGAGSSTPQQSRIPSEVLLVKDSRVVAERFLFDVVDARHDQLISVSRVVDIVCQRGAEHHGGEWDRFLQSICSNFNVQVGASDTQSLAEALLTNKNCFSSAMLSATGANKLEMVFGVPATHFPFLHCAAESIEFVSELYKAAVANFGRWTYENFVAFIHAVFSHDRPEVVRHVPRIFRTLNKSRTGEISFDELCAWIARKLSTRSTRHPEQHLLAIVMSLRLPYAFFVDKRHLWPKLHCVLRSLSDDECHV